MRRFFSTAAPRPRIGFVGATGLMGHGMAKNLLLKGFPVTLHVRAERPRERLADLLALGAREAATPAAMTAASDVVIMCVTGAPEVNSVVYGATGILAAARAGLVVVDASTSEVNAAAATRADLAAKGALFVDAPLTRTPAAAEEGKANTMVGADAATFAALEPVFRAYCEHVIHAGPPGHGLVLKLINNFVGQAITTATAEGLATAAKVGLDQRALHKLMSLGSVNNLMFQFMVGTMLEGGPQQLDGLKFSLSNAMKDVRGRERGRQRRAAARPDAGAGRALKPSPPLPLPLALPQLRNYTHLTESLQQPTPVADAVHSALIQANSLGLGEKYIASLVVAQEKLHNVRISTLPPPAPLK